MKPETAGLDLVEQSRQRQERRTFRRVLGWGFAAFLVALVVVPTNINPVLRVFNIPSSSMGPTLPVESLVLASRLSYGLSRTSYDWLQLPISGRLPARIPGRGDIVVYRLPRDHSVVYVSRVIGLPGDRVQMTKGRLVLNGVKVERTDAGQVPDPSALRPTVQAYDERLPGGTVHRIVESEGDTGPYDDTAEVLVPPGHLFMMGDNRDNSSDSRVPAAQLGPGLVPVDLVIGKVIAHF